MLWSWAFPAFLAAVVAAQAGYNVAIIGAGAAGSSAAVHLQQFAAEAGIAVNATIFEKSERIGGRTLTVNVHDDPAYPVELGASVFIAENWILAEAVKRYQLSTDPPNGALSGDDLEKSIMAIWDGRSIVYQEARDAGGWWTVGKMILRYGLSPVRVYRLVRSTLASFNSLYTEPRFPFASLTQAAADTGLDALVRTTGLDLLAAHQISAEFARQVVQASTRVNYASNLACIHGLETVVSLAAENTQQVRGGNWQIFDHMVRESGASFLPKTSVHSIRLSADDPSSPTHYHISTHADDVPYDVRFDAVVVATPWHQSHLDFSPGRLAIDPVEYTQLQVTLFASPHAISLDFLGQKPDARRPSVILSTLPLDQDGSCFPKAAEPLDFFSISALRHIRNETTGRDEYVYKIFSPEPVQASFLSSLLGVPVPKDFGGSPEEEESETKDKAITWFYTHRFHAYPVLRPRTNHTGPALAPGLFYTSGMETFISTMETNALMGKNVAKLVVDELTARAKRSVEEKVEEENVGEVKEELADEIVNQEAVQKPLPVEL